MRKFVLLLTLVPLVLMTVPYLLFRPSASYNFQLNYTTEAHLVFMSIFTICVTLVVYISAGASPPPSQPPLPGGPRGRFLHQSSGFLFAVFIASHIFLVPAMLAYSHGGFTAARDTKAFSGVGILLRLYIIAVPTFLFYEKNRSRKLLIIVCTSGLVFLRAVLLSERSTVLELASVFTVLDLFHVLRFRRLIIPVGLVSAAALYIGGLQDRLRTQVNLGANDALHAEAMHSGAADTAKLSSVVYYADTQNKAYGLLTGALPPYQAKRFAQVVNFLRPNETEGKLYSAENESSGFTLASLTNPGGLAEDLSDFGWLGLPFALLQFSLLGAVFRRASTNAGSYLVLPFFITWCIEFPRFNYYYLPFIVFLLLFSTSWFGLSRLWPAVRSTWRPKMALRRRRT